MRSLRDEILLRRVKSIADLIQPKSQDFDFIRGKTKDLIQLVWTSSEHSEDFIKKRRDTSPRPTSWCEYITFNCLAQNVRYYFLIINSLKEGYGEKSFLLRKFSLRIIFSTISSDLSNNKAN